MSKNLRRLLPLLLLVFIDSFSYFMVIPILLRMFYVDSYGLVPFDFDINARNMLTGITISLSMVAAIFFGPVIGAASDKYGRKKTLIVCLVAIMVGFLLPIIGIWKKSIFLILLGRFISGIGAISQPVAQASVVDLCQGKEKGFYLSLMALMMTLPVILGPLVGGYLSDSNLISWFDISTPYWAAFFISLLSLCLIILLFEETMQTNMRRQMLSMKDIILGIGKEIKYYHIGFFMVVFFLLELGWSQYYQSISLYLNQQHHYSVQKTGLFNAYMGIMMSFGLLILYPLINRLLSAFDILRYSILLILVGLSGCALFPTSMSQWIFSPLVTIFTGCAYVSLLTLISDRVPIKRQGWVMGYCSTVFILAWILTAFDIGWLLSIYSAFPLYASVSSLILANFILFYMKFNFKYMELQNSN